MEGKQAAAGQTETVSPGTTDALASRTLYDDRSFSALWLVPQPRATCHQTGWNENRSLGAVQVQSRENQTHRTLW